MEYNRQKRQEYLARERDKKQSQRPPTEAKAISAPTTSQPSVPTLPAAKAGLDERFIRRGRGVYKWDNRRGYVWLHNCGRECEAQREVEANNKTGKQLFRIHG